MRKEVEGVHWAWWLFWLLVFWPALIFVWASHNSKIRAAEAHNIAVEIAELKGQLKQPNRVIRRLEKEMRDE